MNFVAFLDVVESHPVAAVCALIAGYIVFRVIESLIIVSVGFFARRRLEKQRPRGYMGPWPR